MKCPNCDQEMETGSLRIESYGALLAPAHLKFENTTIWHDGYIPNAEMGKVVGHQCPKCRLIAFQYPELK